MVVITSGVPTYLSSCWMMMMEEIEMMHARRRRQRRYKYLVALVLYTLWPTLTKKSSLDLLCCGEINHIYMMMVSLPIKYYLRFFLE